MNARIAHGTVVTVAHDLPTHPTKAERPVVDDAAGNFDAIGERSAGLQHRLVRTKAFHKCRGRLVRVDLFVGRRDEHSQLAKLALWQGQDRKSTRLNSSHLGISY